MHLVFYAVVILVGNIFLSVNSAAVLVHRPDCQGGESCLCNEDVGAYAMKPVPKIYYTLTDYNFVSDGVEVGEALRLAGDNVAEEQASEVQMVAHGLRDIKDSVLAPSPDDLFGEDPATSKPATDVSLEELLQMDESVIKSCLDRYINDVIKCSVKFTDRAFEKRALCTMLGECLNSQPIVMGLVDNCIIESLHREGYQRSIYVEDLKLAPVYVTLFRAQSRLFRVKSFKEEDFDEENLFKQCPSDIVPNSLDAIYDVKVLAAFILTGGDSSPTREREEYCEGSVVFFYLHSYLENRYVFLEVKRDIAGKMRYRLSLPEYENALVFSNWGTLKPVLDAYMLKHLVCSIDIHVFKKPEALESSVFKLYTQTLSR